MRYERWPDKLTCDGLRRYQERAEVVVEICYTLASKFQVLFLVITDRYVSGSERNVNQVHCPWSP